MRSIQQCLLVLGAKREDIYKQNQRNSKNHLGMDEVSIYMRLGSRGIRQMADGLYKDSMMRNHPDQYGGDPTRDERCRQIGEAYQRILHILKYH